ncbi:GNAT family N-acetyltransferase [Periweissella cryptocerci]|uniref:GNAT family N-acetyltransferase n=1 Tax=Periweissella cryptocerci TaxID=2506420 RepID=A0A4P6YVL5_9LACO|nr:GNAT family N-acetyltransferase [Periweissella cryptocerci]QBO36844.1 GNAT family N-acetyltransferase [Periweissella cryptocerci]
MIDIRPYHSTDKTTVCTLFYETVHAINQADYTSVQLDAWTDTITDWPARLLTDYGLVAQINHTIVGFGSMTADGELDLLFVHKDFQGQGIATQLASELEADALRHGNETIRVFASITARPFFQKRGYQVIRENTVHRANQILTNFVMAKSIAKTM